MKYSKNCVLLAKNFDVRIFVRLLAKICAHFCAPFSQNMCTFVRFLKIFDVRIFVRLLAKICAHLSLELLNTLSADSQALNPKILKRRFLKEINSKN